MIHYQILSALAIRYYYPPIKSEYKIKKQFHCTKSMKKFESKITEFALKTMKFK